MAVYVDDMRAPFGRMIMAHMIADTQQELMDMAIQIGLKPEWIQKEGCADEHFDVSVSRRRRAIHKGAVPITRRELARKIIEKRRAAAG